MNTKYKATAPLSSDSYNKFTAKTMSEIYDTVKSRVPFDSCKCTFTYCSDNTTVSADINDIPKNLNVQAFEFFVFDFSQNDDYITASFTPDSIFVTVCLPIDFKSSKALAENILKRLQKDFFNYYDSVSDSRTDANSRNKKPWYKKPSFWKIIGTIVEIVAMIIGTIFTYFIKGQYRLYSFGNCENNHKYQYDNVAHSSHPLVVISL